MLMHCLKKSVKKNCFILLFTLLHLPKTSLFVIQFSETRIIQGKKLQITDLSFVFCQCNIKKALIPLTCPGGCQNTTSAQLHYQLQAKKKTAYLNTSMSQVQTWATHSIIWLDRVSESRWVNGAPSLLLAPLNKHLVASRQKNKPSEHLDAAVTFN